MPVVVRLLLAPAVVLLASLVQRRLGHAAGGRLVGLPLTTAPFLAVLALGPGPAVAARAADGIVSGQVSVVVFAVGYTLLARVARWPAALAGAHLVTLLATVLVAVLVQRSSLPVALWAVPVAASAAAAAWLLQRSAGAVTGSRGTPPWELPLRVVVTGAIVGGLTLTTGLLGAFVAGILSTAPVITSVLGPFTHRASGPAAVVQLMGGMVGSMPGTSAFVASMSLLLTRVGLVESLALSLAALVVVDLAVRRFLARRNGFVDVRHG